MRTLAAPFTAIALLLVGSTSFAAEWIAPSASFDKSFASKVTAEDKAQAFVDSNRKALGIESVSLKHVSVLKSPDGRVATVRFEQRHGGLRVVDAGANVRIGPKGELSIAVLEVARDLAVSVTPKLDVSDATDVASRSRGESLIVERSELAVLGRDQGVLVWLLDVRDSLGGTRYVVDALEGKLVGTWSLGSDALGRVYQVSSVSTPIPTDHLLSTLDVSTDPVHLNGWGGLLTVTNYVSGSSMSGFTVSQTVVPSAGVDFLYDPPADVHDATDAFAQVNLFYHLTNMRDFFTTLGVAQTDPKWKITAVANAEDDHMPLDNAFFSEMGQTGAFASPNLIAIGQGSQNDFAYDSDVFKHEFGHYVTHNTVNYNLGNFYANTYGFDPHSGSIDEGIADYFACSDNNDPTLGEATLGPLGGERHLDDASKKCPDDMVGEVHADGEIIGSLSWTIRTDLGQAKGDKIVWGAISLLTPGATFGDFGRGLTQAAADLQTTGDLTQADVDKVKQDIAARGVNDCDQELAVDGTSTRTTNIIGLDVIGQFIGGNCQAAQNQGIAMQSLFHFSRKSVAADSAVRFHIDVVASTPGEVAYTVYIRKAKHVSFGTSGFPAPDKFDAKFDFTTTSGDVVVDALSMPTFEPGAVYHAAVTSASCPNLRITMSASNVGNPPVSATTVSTTSASTGAGTGGGDVGGSGPIDKALDRGCGCELAGDDVVPSWLGVGALVLGFGVVAGRRRRVA